MNSLVLYIVFVLCVDDESCTIYILCTVLAFIIHIACVHILTILYMRMGDLSRWCCGIIV